MMLPSTPQTMHIEIPAEATPEEAEALKDAIVGLAYGETVGSDDPRTWDPFIHSHTGECEESDHCAGPGSYVSDMIIAKALRNAAESTRAETVCCDEYGIFVRTGKRPKYPHHICYWGEAHALALEADAENIEKRWAHVSKEEGE